MEKGVDSEIVGVVAVGRCVDSDLDIQVRPAKMVVFFSSHTQPGCTGVCLRQRWFNEGCGFPR